MVGKAFFLVMGFSAVFAATAHQASAQRSAPTVRINTQPNSSFSTIEPSISLSEPSYILAVAIDRDGQVSVLSPVGPDDAIRFEASRSLRLPEFFSGFSSASTGNYADYRSYHSASALRNMSDDYSAGSVLVIASKTPFNFASISEGPFWNEDAIRKLLRYRDPSSAVYALARAVTGKGQSFGHDFLRFGVRQYYASSADRCFGFGTSAYGYPGSPTLYGYSGFNYGSAGYVIVAPTTTTQGLRTISIGADACGRVRYIVVPGIPPRDSIVLDSALIPQPTVKIAAAPGTYSGDEAVRLFEMVKSRDGSDSYVALPMRPILKENEEVSIGRPVTREAAPERATETFERVTVTSATPIERAAPVLRREEPRYDPPASQPIMRSEPVMNSAPTVQRESKPVQVVLPIKDNQ